MDKKETREERATRKGGENELEGSRSANVALGRKPAKSAKRSARKGKRD